MKKINLGCGTHYLEGFVNVDINKNVKADKYFDLNKFPYPIKGDIYDLVLMDNVLEHLDDVVSVMGEIHRITKTDGIVEIYLPYGKSDGALQDPTHKHFFTEKSMDYFDLKNDYSFYGNYNFEILERKLFNANKTLLSKSRYLIPFKSVLKYFFYNIYDGLYFKIRVVK